MEVNKKFKRMPYEILMLSIMEEYHRTYEEYMDTPQRLIDTILDKRQIDYKVSKLS